MGISKDSEHLYFSILSVRNDLTLTSMCLHGSVMFTTDDLCSGDRAVWVIYDSLDMLNLYLFLLIHRNVHATACISILISRIFTASYFEIQDGCLVAKTVLRNIITCLKRVEIINCAEKPTNHPEWPTTWNKPVDHIQF